MASATRASTARGATVRRHKNAGSKCPTPTSWRSTPTGTPEQQQMVQDHPDMVRFMFTKVLPTMQTLLGAQPYDDTTQTGFSCYACHPSAGAAAK